MINVFKIFLLFSFLLLSLTDLDFGRNQGNIPEISSGKVLQTFLTLSERTPPLDAADLPLEAVEPPEDNPSGGTTLPYESAFDSNSTTEGVKKSNRVKLKAPKAHAGDNQELIDTDKDGKETVRLDGSKSKDKDGNIISYSWRIEGADSELTTGVNPSVELSVGRSTIVLTVTDDEGLTDSDKVKIRIKEGGEDDDDDPANEVPVADAGSDQTLIDEEGEGEVEVALDGSGSRDEDGEIESYSWSISGEEIATGEEAEVKLPVGTHTITLTVTDDAGATATDEVVIAIKRVALLSVVGERDGSEDGTTGSFLISSTEALNDPLTINYSLHGTAMEGEDYTLPGGEFVLEAGQTSLTVPVTIINDDRVEGEETVVLSLGSVEMDGVGIDSTASSAELLIEDNEECFTLTADFQHASCSETPDGTIDITVEGSSGTLSYSWSNGFAGEDLIDVSAGTYELEVLDQVSGCSLSREYVIQVDDQTPPVARGRDREIQLNANGQATLTAQEVNDGSEDNCEINTFSLSKTTFTCDDLGEVEVVLTVEDVNGNTASTRVSIQVEDKLAPVFTANQQFSVPENATVNTSIGTVEAKDNCHPIDWQIVEGNEDGFFQINGSGQIRTLSKLDYERQTFYDLTISATAAGLQSTEVVTIRLENIEEPGPDIGTVLDEYQSVNEDELYAFDIPEDAFEVPEGEELRYSVYGQSAWLGFNEKTLHLEGTPANEDVGIERITIRATDSQGRYAEQHFRLEIINVNDAPHALSLSRNLIQENQPEGTVVGHIRHEDVDVGDQHTYQLVSGEGSKHNAYFTLSKADLLSTRSLDYEVDSMLTIRLAVTDQEGASFEQVFSIKVVNEVDGTAFLPNLFSPNGDSMNDAFILQSTDIETVHWRIFNRQGRLIFETKDREEATQVGWDGYAFGQPQPEGAYVWIVEGTFNDGSPLTVEGKTKGSVTLIR